MSPRSTKQFDDIRKQKKKLILNTALELFAENGFHATSINLIAKKAGISKGLTYNYFESKKEILDDIIQEGFDTIYSNFDINNDGVLSEEEFIYFIRQSFKLMRQNIRYWKLYYSLLLQPKVSESFKEEYLEKANPFLGKLLQFIVSKGSSDPEGDLMAISALLEGAYLFAITAPGMFPEIIMEDKIINACFKIING